MAVVPFYAGLLALLFVLLSIRIIGRRRSAKVALGVAGDRELERRTRVHANFAEYVPLALLLLAFLEFRGWSVHVLHGLGSMLLVGRLSHAWGVSQERENFRFRVTGMALTFGVILTAALLLIGGTAAQFRQSIP